MHIRNYEQPYTSVEDAMKRWPETATAIGIQINRTNNIEIRAPHGLNDLFNMVIRRSKYFRRSGGRFLGARGSRVLAAMGTGGRRGPG